MRWVLVFCLLVAGCAGPEEPKEKSQPKQAKIQVRVEENTKEVTVRITHLDCWGHYASTVDLKSLEEVDAYLVEAEFLVSKLKEVRGKMDLPAEKSSE